MIVAGFELHTTVAKLLRVLHAWVLSTNWSLSDDYRA